MPDAAPLNRAALGRRIHVWGNSCSGKSTLAARLGEVLDAPVVELDALNWRAGWISVRETDRVAFDASVAAACAGDAWVVAGSYSGTSLVHVWPNVQSVVWLDLPRWRLVLRVLRRTWRRARTRELLWGQVRERFWPLLMVWRGEQSLLWWIWTQHARKRDEMRAWMNEARFAHIRFVRFERAVDADDWVEGLAQETD